MKKCFDEMFYKDVDDSERGYYPIDNITVRQIHSWNWDALMDECVIYAFINYWEEHGEGMLETYKNYESYWKDRKWIYLGLRFCYNRIMNNKEIFFGNCVIGDEMMFKTKTLDYIWKYRHLMWS